MSQPILQWPSRLRQRQVARTGGVEVDSGRIMIRAPEESRGVREGQWKEPKVAVLWWMKGDAFTEDPHPELPRCF